MQASLGTSTQTHLVFRTSERKDSSATDSAGLSREWEDLDKYARFVKLRGLKYNSILVWSKNTLKGCVNDINYLPCHHSLCFIVW